MYNYIYSIYLCLIIWCGKRMIKLGYSPLICCRFPVGHWISWQKKNKILWHCKACRRAQILVVSWWVTCLGSPIQNIGESKKFLSADALSGTSIVHQVARGWIQFILQNTKQNASLWLRLCHELWPRSKCVLMGSMQKRSFPSPLSCSPCSS